MISIDRILVTTDFSEYSYYSFPYAIEFAQKFNARLYLLHVIEPIMTPADFAWGNYNIAEIEQRTENYVTESLKKIVEEKFPEDMEVEILIRHGRSFKEIIEACRENGVHLLIMSTHGLGGLSHLIFGSTSEKVVRKSPCPVLTIRHPEHKFEMP
jgi:nucleotide-binding universal stress UspA family protein